MPEQIQEMIDNSVQDQTKVVSLFQFIRELNKLKQKAIVNYAEYPWARTVSSLPDDPDEKLKVMKYLNSHPGVTAEEVQ